MTGPFGSVAPTYFGAGWRGTIPVKGKTPPYVKGRHGKGKPFPTRAETAEWVETFGHANIAIRMPENVIGIDVDAGYKGKRGDETLAEFEAEFGKRPATWSSTSRGEGLCGIYWYQVTPRDSWPGNLGEGSDVDIIHKNNRYAVVYPSIHPETGDRYRWRDPSGKVVSGEFPSPGELAFLPDDQAAGLLTFVPRFIRDARAEHDNTKRAREGKPPRGARAGARTQPGGPRKQESMARILSLPADSPERTNNNFARVVGYYLRSATLGGLDFAWYAEQCRAWNDASSTPIQRPIAEKTIRWRWDNPNGARL